MEIRSVIDLHNHCLPGVDDGSRTFEESLEIIEGLAAQGITEIYLTPHYINGTSQTSPRFENTDRYNFLRAAARHRRLPVTFHLGNEIYIDPDIEKMIRFGKIKALGETDFLLIELPMSGEYPDYEGIFLELIRHGHRVILAHPERYHAFEKDYNRILELNSLGVLFQCNLGSLVGQYGKEAKKTLLKMIKDGLVFGFGTDIHRPRDYTEIKKAIAILEKYYGDGLKRVLEPNLS